MPGSQASALKLVESAIELGVGDPKLLNADPSTLRPVTSGKACKDLEKLVDPDYSVTGQQPEFLVNYFWVDTSLPGPIVVPLAIVVLSRNLEVSTISGPTVFIVYFPFNNHELIGKYLKS